MDRTAHHVCLITDLLSDPLDEGMNRFAFHTASELLQACQLRVLTNAEKPLCEPWISHMSFGKTLTSRSLFRSLREWNPRHVVYIPRASLTTATFFRTWQLRRIVPESHLHVVGLQRRAYDPLGLWMARRSRARFYVPSRFMQNQLAEVGLPTTVLPAGVDIERFRPADAPEKKRLRGMWKVPLEDFVVAHIGPLRRSRNPAWLQRVVEQPGVRLLVVGSESQRAESDVVKSFENARVAFITHYVRQIEELYRLADAYFFPVVSPVGAIEWPLSVLEALACGVPVITTRFGGLNDVAHECAALVFIETKRDIPAALQFVRDHPELGAVARAWAERRTWRAVLSPILEVVQT